jgi:ATP-binding cassette subfamily B protein
MPRALGLVWRSSPLATIGLAVFTLGSALLPIAVAWAGKGIIDAVVARAERAAVRWVAIELALVTALALATRGLAYVKSALGARLSLEVNTLILDKALTLELRHFEDPHFYDQLTRARREASTRPLSFVLGGFQLVQHALSLAGYAAVLVAFRAWAPAALAVAAVPAFVSETYFSKAAFRLRSWRAPETRRMNYLEYVLANDEHAKEVKLLGLGRLLLGRYRSIGEGLYREDQALAMRRAGWAFSLSLLATLAFYGCYALMALAAVRGELTLGALTLYLVAFRQGQQSLQSMLGALGGMYEDNLYMSLLFDYLAIPVRAAPRPADDAARDSRRLDRGIVLENVGFRYPDQERWALRGVSLRIAPGEAIALVGKNGASKTTLIKLLTRLYEPTEGRILLDGRDLADWDAEQLRRRFAVVFQDFNQYQTSARENVGYGSVEDIGDEVRVARAVERGGAKETVAALASGLETQLGRWFKDGVELSGGQWQKLAIARAFMAEQADVLVLDEPTAALDAEAEHAVFERFRALARGKTTLLISHRFSTVRMADRILVFDDGRLVEQGTHAELVAGGGRYAHLFSLQAEGYR